MIRKGADINVANDFGKTALHLAAQKGHDKIAELLVKHGANVHSLDSHGRTPLFWASFKGKKHITRNVLSNNRCGFHRLFRQKSFGEPQRV